MDKEQAKILKAKGIDDEICDCGHSKGYHKAHSLDNHGGECELCDCEIFTWQKFIKYCSTKSEGGETQSQSDCPTEDLI